MGHLRLARHGHTAGHARIPQFYADMERWIWSHYTGSYAAVRPEWSKARAATAAAPWPDPATISTSIPNAFRAGQASGDSWDAAVAILNSYDRTGSSAARSSTHCSNIDGIQAIRRQHARR